LDIGHFPSVRQFPVDLGGNAGIAGKFPVGVPVRDHAEEKASCEWLSRNDRGHVHEKFRLDELATLVGLGLRGNCRSKQESAQESENNQSSTMSQRAHGAIYHRESIEATRPGGSRCALSLPMRKFLVIAVLAGLTWLFIVQKRSESAKPEQKSKTATQVAAASPRPVSEHNWMKNSLDRANEVKRQVAQQRKTDETR
jgi:hypothetical protein